MADVAGVVPAVGVHRPGGRLGVAPVALEEGRAAEEDLAVVGDPELDRRHRPADRPEPVVLAGRARPEAVLGAAVALDDDDAEVLPGLLERRRQERPGRDEQAQAAAEPGVDAPEDQPPGAVGEVAGDRPEAVEEARAGRVRSASRSIALQNRSSTWGTTIMLVTRWARSASNRTRGLRLRTYRMSAPTLSA